MDINMTPWSPAATILATEQLLALALKELKDQTLYINLNELCSPPAGRIHLSYDQNRHQICVTWAGAGQLTSIRKEQLN